MKKKRLIVLLAVIFLVSIITVTAEVPENTAVIGDKAYSLDYVNNTKNVEEIRAAIRASKEIFIKNNSGKWYNNSTAKEVGDYSISNVIYKNNNGDLKLFLSDGEDGIDIIKTIGKNEDVQKNLDTKGNIYITGEKIFLGDSKIEGDIYLDSREEGSAVLKNVDTNNIKILSGGKKGLEFISVKGKKLYIDSKEQAHVFIKEDSSFDEVNIKGQVNITSNEKANIKKVIIEPSSEKNLIELSGEFDRVEINKCAKIKLIDGTINELVANTDLDIDVSGKSDIKNIKENGNKVSQTGEGAAKAPAVGGGGGGYIPSTPDPKPQPKPDPDKEEIMPKSLRICSRFEGQEKDEIIELDYDEVNIIGGTLTLSDNSEVCMENWYSSTTGAAITWRISNDGVLGMSNRNPLIAEINSLRRGKSILTCTVKYKDIVISDDIEVNVLGNDYGVNIITEDGVAKLDIGESIQLKTEVCAPENTTYSSITWESEDEEIATVEDGKITGVAPGATFIDASVKIENATYSTILKVIVEDDKANGTMIISENGGAVEEFVDYLILSTKDYKGTEAEPVKFVQNSDYKIKEKIKVLSEEGSVIELYGINLDSNIDLSDARGKIIFNGVMVDKIEGKSREIDFGNKIDLTLAKGCEILVKGDSDLNTVIFNGDNNKIIIEDGSIFNLIGDKNENPQIKKSEIILKDEGKVHNLQVSNKEMIIDDKTSKAKELEDIIEFIVRIDENITINNSKEDNLVDLAKKTNEDQEFIEKINRIAQLRMSMNLIEWVLYESDISPESKVCGFFKVMDLIGLEFKDEVTDQIEVFKFPESYVDQEDDDFPADYLLNSIEYSYEGKISNIFELNKLLYGAVTHEEMRDTLGNLIGKSPNDLIDLSGLSVGDRIENIIRLKDESGKKEYIDLFLDNSFGSMVNYEEGNIYLAKNYMCTSSANSIVCRVSAMLNYQKPKYYNSLYGEHENIYLKATGLELIDEDIHSAQIIKNGENYEVLVQFESAEESDELKYNVYYNDSLLSLKKVESRDINEEWGETLGTKVIDVYQVENPEVILEDRGAIKVTFGEGNKYIYQAAEREIGDEFEPILELECEGASEDNKIHLSDLEKDEEYSVPQYKIKFKIRDTLNKSYLTYKYVDASFIYITAEVYSESIFSDVIDYLSSDYENKELVIEITLTEYGYEENVDTFRLDAFSYSSITDCEGKRMPSESYEVIVD